MRREGKTALDLHLPKESRLDADVWQDIKGLPDPLVLACGETVDEEDALRLNDLFNRVLPQAGCAPIHAEGGEQKQVFDVRAPEADRAEALLELGWSAMPSKKDLLLHVLKRVETEHVDSMLFGGPDFDCDNTPYDDCDELDEENFIFDDDGAYRYPGYDSD